MSHFTVMVIGENPEKQLEPFDENIEVDKYVEDEVSEEEIKSFMDYYKKEGKIFESTSFEEAYEKYGNDWNSGRFEKDESGKWLEYSQYNPKSKWDWYQIGGRWAGHLLLKSGCEPIEELNFSWGWKEEDKQEILSENRADFAYKKDIDIDKMRLDAKEKAKSNYIEVHSIIDKFEPMKDWEYVREQMFPGDIDKAREFYRNQEQIKAFDDYNKKNDYKFGHFSDVLTEVQMSEDDYLRLNELQAIATFAMLKDGEWNEKGSMGWFGIVTDEKDVLSWLEAFNKIFDELPEDTLISIYDCHI